MSDTVDGHTLKNAATALWEAGVLPMSGDQADKLAEALAAAGLLAAPADEAGQWVKQIDNPKELPGLLLRMADLLDALESLPASLRRCADVARIQANASPAAPADDEATTRPVALSDALKAEADRIAEEAYVVWRNTPNRDAYVSTSIRDAARRAALAALREGKQ